MKASKIIIVIVVVVVIVIAALAALSLLVPSGPSSKAWNTAYGYPIEVDDAFGVGGQQCGSSGTYVYCVGGADADGGPRNTVYADTLSSSGNITNWIATAGTYPDNIYAQSCVTSSGYVYCVGGSYDPAGDDVASSFYAPLPSGGPVGNWTATTSYPVPIDSESCVASSSYIYCVAGNNETDGTYADSTNSSAVYFASLSSNGIGAWKPSTPYPSDVLYPTCFSSGGYIYCVGGADTADNAVSAAYYAPLTSSGVGAWTATTSYKVTASGQSCAVYSGYVYCVGGEGGSSFISGVYYAPLTSAGIGSWTQASSYPLSVETTCVVASGNLYCVGGFNNGGEYNNVYYASLSALTTAATT